jgi:hypothetical protein
VVGAAPRPCCSPSARVNSVAGIQNIGFAFSSLLCLVCATGVRIIGFAGRPLTTASVADVRIIPFATTIASVTGVRIILFATTISRQARVEVKRKAARQLLLKLTRRYDGG